MKRVESSLKLDLDLSLPLVLRPCLRRSASWTSASSLRLSSASKPVEPRARVGRVRIMALLSILRGVTLLS